MVIHRAILGSLDRFIAFILEETKGLLPAWLSPVQVQIITVNENVIAYAQDVENKLKSLKVRVETDFSNESVGKKIRSAVLSKSPFILVLGDKEKADETVAVRKRGSKDTETMPYKQFEEMLLDSIANKALN